MNLREKILTSSDIVSESLYIKEWGVTLLIKGMTAGERIRLTQNAYDPKTQNVNMASVYPDIVVAVAHDPDSGEPLFTDSDRNAIMGKSSRAIEEIAAVGLRLSGIGTTEDDAAGKDFSSPLSEDSSSN
jgi:hypothetical protein